MVTIVLVNWNRRTQLLKTLESMSRSKSKDFNVVIVDNRSDIPLRLEPYPFEIHILNLSTEIGTASFIAAHNYGFDYALKNLKPDIVIMQHAEMYHQGDVISYAEKVTDKTYISFGCYSLGVGEEPETVKMNHRSMTFDGDSAWYNHPVHRPRKTNFCSAITADNLRKLNGFDERFCEGAWFDDDYFLLQIQRLGLEVELCIDPFTFHQNHPIIWGDSAPIFHNRDLFNVIKNETGYKAQHKYTPDF